MLQKAKVKSLVILASILLVLVIPLTVLNTSNLTEIRNFADTLKEQEDKSMVILKTSVTDNIPVGDSFVINYMLSNAKSLPFDFVAIRIEYDNNYVNIKDIELKNENLTTVKTEDNTIYIIPGTIKEPKALIKILNDKWHPTICNSIGGCYITPLKQNTIQFKINAVLSKSVTPAQRPIRITYFAMSKLPTKILWSSNIDDPFLPELIVANNFKIKNTPPEITSKPVTKAIIGQTYLYELNAKDADGDKVKFSLNCPTMLFCKDKPLTYPDGFKLDKNVLTWQVEDIGKKEIPVRLYASDGKSVTEQNFTIKIYAPEQSKTECSFVSAANPYKIAYNLPTPLLLQAENADGIKSIKIEFINKGNVENTLNYEFNTPQTKVVLDEKSQPPLIYTFNKGEYQVKATIIDSNNLTKICYLTLKSKDNKERSLTKFIVSSKFIVKAQSDEIVPTSNTGPTIISNYKDTTGDNTGNNVNINTTYHYTLIATDSDNDILTYSIVRRPTTWSGLTITATRSDPGRLEVTINGTPTSPGSYTFSISVSDGYNWTTQTWIVNVTNPNNEAPEITILQPTGPLTLKRGQSLTISWEAEDEQQIKSFGLYYATDPNDKSTYVTIKSNIKYTVRNYIYKTGLMPGGTYYFILTATDSYDPPATSKAIIGPITIVAPTPTPTPSEDSSSSNTGFTDTNTNSNTNTSNNSENSSNSNNTQIQQNDFILINVLAPEQDSHISQRDFKVMAKIIASKDATLKSDDIHVYLNFKDVTKEVSFSRDKGELISLVYRPAEQPPVGENVLKITAKDSKGKSQESLINFIIDEEDTTDNIQDETEYYTLFGYKLTKTQRNILYLLLGLAALIIILPLILYISSLGETKKTQSDRQVTKQVTNTPPTPPSSNNNTNLYPWLNETAKTNNSTNNITSAQTPSTHTTASQITQAQQQTGQSNQPTTTQQPVTQLTNTAPNSLPNQAKTIESTTTNASYVQPSIENMSTTTTDSAVVNSTTPYATNNNATNPNLNTTPTSNTNQPQNYPNTNQRASNIYNTNTPTTSNTSQNSNMPPTSADIPNLKESEDIPGQKISPGTTISIN